MKSAKYFVIGTIVVLLISNKGYSQTDSLLKYCTKNMSPQYISDGQQYISILNGEEIAEFRATFFGGTTYRIAACSGMSKNTIIFTLYDSPDPLKRKELFSNRNFQNSPYWDFKFTSTMECVIEAQLVPSESGSGFAILLIGFKK